MVLVRTKRGSCGKNKSGRGQVIGEGKRRERGEDKGGLRVKERSRDAVTGSEGWKEKGEGRGVTGGRCFVKNSREARGEN